jgi:large subunit ribosomal protein L24
MLGFKKIKKDDIVKIISGKDSTKSGKIIEIDRQKGRVIIEGLNLKKKSIKKSQKNKNGGITDVESFLDISNVMLVCPSCKKATRVGIKVEEDKKHRFCKKCNAAID